jgi:tetratricopeptide (TPR) repeat protein
MNLRFRKTSSTGVVFALLTIGPLSSLSSQSVSPRIPATTEQSRGLLQEGKSLAAGGRLAEAEPPLLQAATLAPRDLETLTVLAQVQARIGKTTEAINGFQRIVRLYPQLADSHLNLAIAFAGAGQLDAALKEASSAASLAPKMASVHINLGRILDDLHRVDAASKEFAIAQQLDPVNADCLYYWSLVERERGNAFKESELLQRLVALQPDNYKAAYSLGRSLQEQARDTEAISALRRALVIKPDYEGALYLLSRELRKRDPEESQRLLQEFHAVQQKQSTLDQSKSLGNEAYAAAGKQNWPEAIRLLREAIELCDSCEAAAGLHKNLGLALCKDGDIQQGRAELETSLHLNLIDPDVVKALEIIGR